MNNNNSNPKNKPSTRDIKQKLKKDTEFGKDLSVEPETLGELPLVGGLKTKEQVAMGEKMLMDQYKKKPLKKNE